MSAASLTPFDPETKDFVLGELEDMGAAIVIAGLEAILNDASGAVVSLGATQEMMDGSAAAALANADIVAIALGYPRAEEAVDVLAAVAPYEADLRGQEGLADLALRALDVLRDPASRYAATAGAAQSPQEFARLLDEVAARLTQAGAAYPGTWDYQSEQGQITLTMYPEGKQGAAHE